MDVRPKERQFSVVGGLGINPRLSLPNGHVVERRLVMERIEHGSGGGVMERVARWVCIGDCASTFRTIDFAGQTWSCKSMAQRRAMLAAKERAQAVKMGSLECGGGALGAHDAACMKAGGGSPRIGCVGTRPKEPGKDAVTLPKRNVPIPPAQRQAAPGTVKAPAKAGTEVKVRGATVKYVE